MRIGSEHTPTEDADDEIVLALAQSQSRVLLTEEQDFGLLAYAGGHDTAGVLDSLAGRGAKLSWTGARRCGEWKSGQGRYEAEPGDRVTTDRAVNESRIGGVRICANKVVACVRLSTLPPNIRSQDARQFTSAQHFHQFEGLAVAIPWGFESPLPHHLLNLAFYALPEAQFRAPISLRRAGYASRSAGYTRVQDGTQCAVRSES
jgi:hypothetical protein